MWSDAGDDRVGLSDPFAPDVGDLIGGGCRAHDAENKPDRTRLTASSNA
jgi:hypothetical protein